MILKPSFFVYLVVVNECFIRFRVINNTLNLANYTCFNSTSNKVNFQKNEALNAMHKTNLLMRKGLKRIAKIPAKTRLLSFFGYCISVLSIISTVINFINLQKSTVNWFPKFNFIALII